MPVILAPAPAAVKPAPAIGTAPVVDFYPEREVDATFDASFALWMEEERADDDQWSDSYADEMAGLALAESRLEMGLMAW